MPFKNLKFKVVVLGLVMVLVSYLIIPLGLAQGYAQSKVLAKINNTTTFEKVDLWQPRFLIFSLNEDLLKANLITLERDNYGLTWKVSKSEWYGTEVSADEVRQPQMLNKKINDLREKLRDGSLNLVSSDSELIESLAKPDIQDQDDNNSDANSPNQIIESEDGEYSLEIIPLKDENKNGFKLVLNGEDIENITDFVNGNFDTSGKYLYYNTTGGVVKRLDLTEGTIDELFKLDSNGEVNLLADTQFVVSQNSKGQLEIYDLQKKIIKKLELKEYSLDLEKLIGQSNYQELRIQKLEGENLYFGLESKNSDNLESIALLNLKTVQFQISK
ncbi:MAG: hypothetical protein OHK0017_10970 [Patescibacteria group bacterium]